MPSSPALTVAADCVGAVSIVLGGLLTVAPRTSGRWLGLEGTHATRTRALGAADLGLGVAIMAGRSSRSRWSSVAVRSLLHLVFAGEYLQNGRVPGAAGMCALFVVDAGIAAGLRWAGLEVHTRHAPAGPGPRSGSVLRRWRAT